MLALVSVLSCNFSVNRYFILGALTKARQYLFNKQKILQAKINLTLRKYESVIRKTTKIN